MLSFLDKASERIEKSYKELIDSLDLPDGSHLSSSYLSSMNFYKEALESSDPNVVLEQTQAWMKIETPCITFMSSIKDVIVLHKKRLGIEENDENKDLANYIFINSGHLFQQPFMTAYEGTVRMLSEQMMLMSPGRKAMFLALTTAMTLIAPEKIMQKEKILENIEKHKEERLPVPKICEKILC
jgi:hypothetical protein